MTRSKTVIDLDDPAFPHGTLSGYRAGCRSSDACPAKPRTCAQMNHRRRKHAQWRAAGLASPIATDLIPAGPVQAHVRELLKVPGSSYTVIAKLADMSLHNVSEVMQRRSVQRRTARAVMGVTPEQIRAYDGVGGWRPVTRRHRQVIKSMQVQGWNAAWQAEQLGRCVSWVRKVASGGHRSIQAVDEVALLKLAGRMEGKWGPHRHAATVTRNQGWHPLTAYDDNGRLLRGAVRNEDAEKRAQAHDRAVGRQLDVLWYTLAKRQSGREIARTFKITEKTVDRIRAKYGLSVMVEEQTPVTVRIAPRPECAALAADLLGTLRGAYDDPTADRDELLRAVTEVAARHAEQAAEAERAAAEAAAADAMGLRSAA